jgi:hypothetical protein
MSNSNEREAGGVSIIKAFVDRIESNLAVIVLSGGCGKKPSRDSRAESAFN